MVWVNDVASTPPVNLKKVLTLSIEESFCKNAKISSLEYGFNNEITVKIFLLSADVNRSL